MKIFIISSKMFILSSVLILFFKNSHLHLQWGTKYCSSFSAYSLVLLSENPVSIFGESTASMLAELKIYKMRKHSELCNIFGCCCFSFKRNNIHLYMFQIETIVINISYLLHNRGTFFFCQPSTMHQPAHVLCLDQ